MATRLSLTAAHDPRTIDRRPGRHAAGRRRRPRAHAWPDYGEKRGLVRITKTLDEGIRHRGIKVVVSSLFETKILTRAEAGDRGAPYYDLTSGG